MKLGPLLFAQRTVDNHGNPTGVLLAAWHWPWSITWSWQLYWHRLSPSVRRGFKMITFRRRQKMIVLNTPVLGTFGYSSQGTIDRCR
jgi:hypothetical protein